VEEKIMNETTQSQDQNQAVPGQNQNQAVQSQNQNQEQAQGQNRLTRQDDRLNRARRGVGHVTPPANISAAPDAYYIEVEMPGVSKEGLEVLAEAGELTVIGRRKRDLPDGELVYLESLPADFMRTFELSADVDTTKIEAHLDQGILKLRLPKREDFKPRKIEIQD